MLVRGTTQKLIKPRKGHLFYDTLVLTANQCSQNVTAVAVMTLSKVANKNFYVLTCEGKT